MIGEHFKLATASKKAKKDNETMRLITMEFEEDK